MIDHRIHTFLVLYKEMNYRRTAQLLNITQPGVTQHIQYLEALYGVKFFHYDGKALSRTPEADRLKESLTKILTEEAELRSILEGDQKTSLRVGATKTIGDFVISPLIGDYLEDPSHHLELRVDNTHALLEAIDDGALDFALIEGFFDKSKYKYQLFREERFLGICGKDHPFADSIIPLEEIFGEMLILREQGSGTRGIFEQILHSQGYSLTGFQRAITINSFSAIQSLLAKTTSITFAFQSIAQGNGALSTFEIEGIQVAREFNYVFVNEGVARDKIRVFLGENCDADRAAAPSLSIPSSL